MNLNLNLLVLWGRFLSRYNNIIHFKRIFNLFLKKNLCVDEQKMIDDSFTLKLLNLLVYI